MTPTALEEAIRKERSPQQWKQIICEVNDNPALFMHLVSLAYGNDELIAFRASWIMDKTSEQHNEIVHLNNALAEIITKTPLQVNQSVIRGSLRLLNRYALPWDDCGELVNSCFNWLEKSGMPVAVKVHSMQLLFNSTKAQPEFKNELIILIEDQMEFNSAAFKARGRMLLKKLHKMK